MCDPKLQNRRTTARLFILLAILMASMSTFASEGKASCLLSVDEEGNEVAYLDKYYPSKPQRDYTEKGVFYKVVPKKNAASYIREGHASWYGEKSHGKHTANGEVFDMYAYTAAHATLPIPSCVRVTNLDNGKSVVVRINDRGPFSSDLGTDTSKRIIDVSMIAAKVLGMRKKGIANVEVDVIPIISTQTASN